MDKNETPTAISDGGITLITERKETGVLYEVWSDGQRVWSQFVAFGRDRRHRVGGAAFSEAATAQENEADRCKAQKGAA